VRIGPVTSLANVRGVADIAEIEGLIRTALPGSQVSVEDMAGGDHLYAHVRAPQFTGLPLIEQHRLVNGAVDHMLGPGRPIHALKIKTEATQ
jgi:stress-induced morphogen